MVSNNSAASAHQYLAELPWVKVKRLLWPGNSYLVHAVTLCGCSCVGLWHLVDEKSWSSVKNIAVLVILPWDEEAVFFRAWFYSVYIIIIWWQFVHTFNLFYKGVIHTQSTGRLEPQNRSYFSRGCGFSYVLLKEGERIFKVWHVLRIRWFWNCFHPYCFCYSPGSCYCHDTLPFLYGTLHELWGKEASWLFLFSVVTNILEVLIPFLKVMFKPCEKLPHVK